MVLFVDARLLVRFGSLAEAGEGDAVLVEGEAVAEGFPVAAFGLSAPGHAAGCACCLPRSAAGVALARLFEQRARGQVGFFTRVLAVTATAAGEAAIRAALERDPLASGRFRLA